MENIQLSVTENIFKTTPLKPIFEIDFNFCSKDPLIETVAIDVLISQLHKFFCF